MTKEPLTPIDFVILLGFVLASLLLFKLWEWFT
jgi:hypothetical protein